MRKPIILLLIIGFLFLSLAPLYANGQMTEYLCELGIKFYRQGRYEEALNEFKKALIVSPNYRPAMKYIEMIEQTLNPPSPAQNEAVEEKQSQEYISEGRLINEHPAITEKQSAAEAPAVVTPAVITGPPVKIPEKKEKIELANPPETIIFPKKRSPAPKTKEMSLKEILDLAEIQKEMIDYENAMRRRMMAPAISLAPPARPGETKPNAPRIIILSETANALPQQIEIEQGKEVVILGKNINRYLITEPSVISAEKRTPDELDITGKTIGYSDVIVWDDNGRWTQQFLGIFPKPEVSTYEELVRREAERERNFKLRYTIDWLSFETGKSMHEWRRSSYSWTHGLNLTGPTPYGDFDATTNIRVDNPGERGDMNYLTMGLTNGQFGNFKGFHLRAFDFTPSFSDMAFPGATLRGGLLESPAFNNKINYSAFWGREGGGRYGGLSPSLSKTLNSFVEGYNIALTPDKVQTYKFSLTHGWGRQRASYLRPYDYDLSGKWNFNKWGLGYEAANDTQSFAHLVDTHYINNKLTHTMQFRDIDKRFMSITGPGWRQGEIGGLLTTSYQPTEALGFRSSVDIYKDRLFPSQKNPKRFNEDIDLGSTYNINPDTSTGLTYALHNDRGKISESRYQSEGATFTKRFHFIKDISSFVNFNHQEYVNYNSHTSDYIDNRVNAGLRFNLAGQWYYFANTELHWLNEQFYDTTAHPKYYENGLEWDDQFWKTPFYGSFRLTYHKEQDTDSNLSFLSGESYLEGYQEISYRPTNDLEIYGSGRVRNVWADNSNIAKRIEGTFNAGLRYLWDTGFRFEAKGNIAGYVFKDLNGDGLRQRDEAPVEGVRVWLGKDKSCVTDVFGYYEFKGVKGRKAYVNLDTSTLPQGFVLTIPATQEVAIVHKRTVDVSFGIASRTEINGLVFDDVDGNGEFNRGDKGVGGILLTLESGQKARTDSYGRYSFNNVSVGEHTISLDLGTVPVYFLPELALKETISVAEGAVVTHHIPLRRIKEQP